MGFVADALGPPVGYRHLMAKRLLGSTEKVGQKRTRLDECVLLIPTLATDASSGDLDCGCGRLQSGETRAY
jgi:hypothetical protein